MVKKSFLLLAFAVNSYIGQAQETSTKSWSEIHQEEVVILKELKSKLTLGVGFGRWQMFSHARADSTGLLDISDYHRMLNLNMGYYIRENTAITWSLSMLIIPKEKKIDSLSWTPGTGLGGIRAKAHGKGGIAIPLNLGVRRSFLTGFTRPYISGGLGLTYMYIGEGSAIVIGGDRDKDIHKESRIIPSWNIAAGVQHRIGRAVRLNLGLDIYGSAPLSSEIGSIKQFSGWYLSGGLQFILNPGKR
ncbi:MAG: hypothetical protein HC830_11885 [Bacteroidetes bacterium]|nr:hypothetical protein [Bacteroidota bacterium]